MIQAHSASIGDAFDGLPADRQRDLIVYISRKYTRSEEQAETELRSLDKRQLAYVAADMRSDTPQVHTYEYNPLVRG